MKNPVFFLFKHKKYDYKIIVSAEPDSNTGANKLSIVYSDFYSYFINTYIADVNDTILYMISISVGKTHGHSGDIIIPCYYKDNFKPYRSDFSRWELLARDMSLDNLKLIMEAF